MAVLLIPPRELQDLIWDCYSYPLNIQIHHLVIILDLFYLDFTIIGFGGGIKNKNMIHIS